MTENAELARAWKEAEAAMPEGWQLDSLQCASTGLTPDERSDDWVALAIGPGGEERRAVAEDPIVALAELVASFRAV